MKANFRFDPETFTINSIEGIDAIIKSIIKDTEKKKIEWHKSWGIFSLFGTKYFVGTQSFGLTKEKVKFSINNRKSKYSIQSLNMYGFKFNAEFAIKQTSESISKVLVIINNLKPIIKIDNTFVANSVRAESEPFARMPTSRYSEYMHTEDYEKLYELIKDVR